MKRVKNSKNEDLIFPELPTKDNVDNEKDTKENLIISPIEKVRGMIIDKQTKILQYQLKKSLELADLQKEVNTLDNEINTLSHEIAIYDTVLDMLNNEDK